MAGAVRRAEVRSAFSVFRGFCRVFVAALRRDEIGMNRLGSASDAELVEEVGGVLGLMHFNAWAVLRMVSRVSLLGFKSNGKASSLATLVKTMRITSETVRPISPSTAVAFAFTSALILERTTAFVAIVIL